MPKGSHGAGSKEDLKIRAPRTSALTALQKPIISLIMSLSNIMLPPQTRLTNRPHQSLRSGTLTKRIINMISRIFGRHWMRTIYQPSLTSKRLAIRMVMPAIPARIRTAISRRDDQPANEVALLGTHGNHHFL